MTREIFFFKKHAENETVRLIPDLTFFKKKCFMGGKKMGCILDLI